MHPQPNPRAAWPSSDDNTAFYLLVILADSTVGGYVLWEHDHAAISAVVMPVQHWQMRLIHYFTHRYGLADWQVQQANPNDVTFWQPYGLCRDVGRFFRIPAALIMFLLGAGCFVCARRRAIGGVSISPSSYARRRRPSGARRIFHAIAHPGERPRGHQYRQCTSAGVNG